MSSINNKCSLIKKQKVFAISLFQCHCFYFVNISEEDFEGKMSVKREAKIINAKHRFS